MWSSTILLLLVDDLSCTVPGSLNREVHWACPTGRLLRGKPRTLLRDYFLSWLALYHLWVLLAEEEDVSLEMGVFA